MENKLKKIFIIAGRARQGKDTVCEFIREYYKDYKILHLPNNYYMRDYAKRIIGWDLEDASKPRELLIELADYGRSLNEHFYINRTIEDIIIFSRYYDIIVIPDARFPYEIEIPKEKFENVISINIKRPNYDSELSISQKNHPIETSLEKYDNYDYKIINDGNLQDLKNKVFEILDKIEVK